MIADNTSLDEQVRSEVCRRRRELDFIARQASTSDDVSTPRDAGSKPRNEAGVKARANLDLQPAAAVPSRIRLRDLLRYHDRRFVEYAYQCVLDRPMDSGGEWFIEQLRNGSSRIDVLLKIRYGREGKDRGVRIRGMRMLRLLSRAKRFPILGILFRCVAYAFCLLWRFLRLPLEHREQEAWKQHVMSLFTKMEGHVNRGDAHVASALDQIGSEYRRTQSDIKDLLERDKAAGAQLQAIEPTVLKLESLGAQLKAVESTVLKLESLHEEFRQVAAQVNGVESEQGRLRQAISRKPDNASVSKEIEALTRRLSEAETGNAKFEALSQQRLKIEEVQSEVKALSQRPSEVEELRAEISALAHRLGETERGLIEIGSNAERHAQLGPMRVELDVMARRLDRIAASPAGQDEFYASLEDRFRGSPEEIRERQEHYLPFVQAASAGTPGAPVLDLGCGRGEWLGLLKNRGLVGYGVEANEIFVSRCRREELKVERDDVLRHLESLPPASVGAVTGFHIIEHLPGDQQIRLAQLTFRALRPGGVLVLETPNPEHLSVAALRFYLDPTHIRPVPQALLEFIVRYAGFDNVCIEHRDPSGDGEAAQGWSRFQDYAVIAIRPTDVPE